MSNEANEKSRAVLLVEDSPADTQLIEEAIREMNLPWRLSTVTDAIEAKSFLHKEGNYMRALRPNLILLDLNLPKKQGLELLEEIKKDQELMEIPVVILSASSWDIDILKSYSLHANCYLTKPIHLDQFMKLIKTIDEFWFETVKLPLRT